MTAPFTLLQPPLITLTTDFGLSDMYVGAMKGVLLGIAPTARLVDLTHSISPQNVLEASARLDANIDVFPPGTIHLVVVDPGVGGTRAACVVQTDSYLFVAPDNGVLTLSLARRPARRCVLLTEKAQPFLRRPVSATFHGRDVFAPVAAHLAMGLPLEALGEEVAPESLVTLTRVEPTSERDAAGKPRLRVPILYADRFGNLITALTPEQWTEWRRAEGRAESDADVVVQAGTQKWRGIVRTFVEASVGDPLAYWGSDGRLEIAVRDGNAAAVLNLSPGDAITLVQEL